MFGCQTPWMQKIWGQNFPLSYLDLSTEISHWDGSVKTVKVNCKVTAAMKLENKHMQAAALGFIRPDIVTLLAIGGFCTDHFLTGLHVSRLFKSALRVSPSCQIVCCCQCTHSPDCILIACLSVAGQILSLTFCLWLEVTPCILTCFLLWSWMCGWHEQVTHSWTWKSRGAHEQFCTVNKGAILDTNLSRNAVLLGLCSTEMWGTKRI